MRDATGLPPRLCRGLRIRWPVGLPTGCPVPPLAGPFRPVAARWAVALLAPAAAGRVVTTVRVVNRGLRPLRPRLLPARGGEPLFPKITVEGDHEFYDFEAKYLDAGDFDIPAVLPDRVTRQVQEYACRTFTALDCAGLARVDFFVTPELDVYLNEINTMPGFTPVSMFPLMWKATGLDYPALVDRLVRELAKQGSHRLLQVQGTQVEEPVHRPLPAVPAMAGIQPRLRLLVKRHFHAAHGLQIHVAEGVPVHQPETVVAHQGEGPAGAASGAEQRHLP